MSEKIFCGEGQEKAEIRINGINYISYNPPIKVENIEGGYLEYTYRYNLQNYVIWRKYNGDSRELIGTIQELDSAPYPYTKITVTYTLVGTPIFYDYTVRNVILVLDNTTYQNYSWFQNFEYFPSRMIASDTQGEIYSQLTPFEYQIKCDGCEPGECKGNNSKYPGYICLDCKEIESRLNNISRKLDNVARRK